MGAAHRGWLPHAAYLFIVDVTERFGRPEAPIVLRVPQSAAE
jgi:hypothetical protein